MKSSRVIFTDPTTAALLAFVVVLSIFALGQTIYYSGQAESKDYLDYPIPQQVHNRLAGIDGPAALVTDDLSVTGEKCNKHYRSIRLHGVIEWISVDPAGTVIPVGEAAGVRVPGCIEKTFLNPIPAAVLKRSQELFRNGTPYVVWKITGTETPDDHRIQAESWETEPFALYAEVQLNKTTTDEKRGNDDD